MKEHLDIYFPAVLGNIIDEYSRPEMNVFSDRDNRIKFFDEVLGKFMSSTGTISKEYIANTRRSIELNTLTIRYQTIFGVMKRPEEFEVYRNDHKNTPLFIVINGIFRLITNATLAVKIHNILKSPRLSPQQVCERVAGECVNA